MHIHNNEWLYDADKTETWFKEMAQRFMPSENRSFRNDFKEKLKLYQFFNNDLSQYIPTLTEMSNDVISAGAAEDLLLHYNKIRQKYDILEGDLLNRGNNHKILLLSAKAVQSKNRKFLDRITKSVEEDMALVLEKAINDMSTMTEEELREFIENQRRLLTPKDMQYKNYLSDLEIYKTQMLNFCHADQDIIRKKKETWKDAFTISEFYLYNGWEHGKPSIQVINPLYFTYHKSINEPFAHKGDWACYNSEISVGEFLDEVINYMPKEKISQILHTSFGSNSLSKDHISRFVYDYTKTIATLNLIQGSGTPFDYVGTAEKNDNNRIQLSNKIRKAHLEFKAYKKVLFYSYKDGYGDDIMVMLNGNANIIPSHASKVEFLNDYFEKDFKYIWDEDGNTHEVHIMQVPRRYEVTRWGSTEYDKMREVPFQPDLVYNPVSGFTLSYKGGVMYNRNAEAVSLMQNGLPYAMQIIAAKALQNKEMSKYRGFELFSDLDQLPYELMEEGDEAYDLLTKVEVIAKKTGNRWYSSKNTSNGLQTGSRSKGVDVAMLGQAQEFVNLQNFIELLDIELGMAMGVSKIREGNPIKGTNVTDNQQALLQVNLQTEPYYHAHAEIWNEAISEYLCAYDQYFKKWFRGNPDSNEHLLEYISSDGTKELIQVLPEYLEGEQIGLFVTTGYSDQQYANILKEKLIQNTIEEPLDVLSGILKEISNNASAEEIHRKIQEFSDDQRRRQEAQVKREQEMAAQLKSDQGELLAYQSELRKDEKIAEQVERRLTATEAAEIESKRFQLAADIDQNKQADSIQKEEIKQDAEDKRQDKELAFKREELQSKEKIAKMKPTPKTTSK